MGKGGIYDKYEGATDWKMMHDSTTDRDHLRVYARTRHTGETEYRLFTKVNNITPRDYLELQTNVELRATWDDWIKEWAIFVCQTEISIEHVVSSCSFECLLIFVPICSIRILNQLKVMDKRMKP